MSTTADVKADLARCIAKAMYMHVADIDEDAPFSDFGLESITLARVLDEICRTHGCTISVAELLSHQSLRAASVFIAGRIEEQVGAGQRAQGGRQS